MKQPQFADNEIYHLYNRGVEKRIICTDDKDRVRFIKSLQVFNTTAPATNLHRDSLFEVELQTGKLPHGKPLVEILAFCLMPNHYHLMARQISKNGITEFMRKLGTGYTNYFNLRHDRVGHLFQGRFKAIVLEKEAHFVHLPHYIHLNPLDLFMPGWRGGKVKNVEKALVSLQKYRWSSLPDYLGMHNFPKVTQRMFLTECVGRPRAFLYHMQEWIRMPNFDLIPQSILRTDV